MLSVGSVLVWHADDLQAIDFGYLVFKNADAAGADGFEELFGAAEFFVIAFDKESAELGLELIERRGSMFGVDGGSVV